MKPFLFLLALISYQLHAHNVLEELPGCYQVDYSYSEIESLKKDYQLDSRVYDASSKSNVFELFFPLIIENKKLHFQRVLFTRTESGEVKGLMKHYAEVLSKNENFFYAFTGNHIYSPQQIEAPTWVREVRYLDDGPSYSCKGKWGAFSNDEYFECNSYASIPGRESRDMGRKDYNALERNTKLIFSSWGILERQNNIKTIHQNDNTKIPLAKEVGKVFSIKVSDDLCFEAKQWAEARKDFWLISIEIWNEFLNGTSEKVVEVSNQNGLRFMKIWDLAEKYIDKNLSDKTNRDAAKEDLRKVISQFVK